MLTPMPDSFASHRPYAVWAYTLLRIFAAAILMQHGAQKRLGLLGGEIVPFGQLQWFGGWIEFVGGGLVLLGLFTRVAAFIISGEMAVAYFMVHYPRGFWPILNKGELAAVLAFVFLYIAAAGAGSFSLDHLLTRRRARRVMG